MLKEYFLVAEMHETTENLEKPQQHFSALPGSPHYMLLAHIPLDLQFSLCQQGKCRMGAAAVLWE